MNFKEPMVLIPLSEYQELITSQGSARITHLKHKTKDEIMRQAMKRYDTWTHTQMYMADNSFSHIVYASPLRGGKHWRWVVHNPARFAKMVEEREEKWLWLIAIDKDGEPHDFMIPVQYLRDLKSLTITANPKRKGARWYEHKI